MGNQRNQTDFQQILNLGKLYTSQRARYSSLTRQKVYVCDRTIAENFPTAKREASTIVQAGPAIERKKTLWKITDREYCLYIDRLKVMANQIQSAEQVSS